MRYDAENGKLSEAPTRADIYRGLLASRISERMKAISFLTELHAGEVLEISEAVLKLEGNLGMKLEILRVLPHVVNPQNVHRASRVLETALEDNDPEIRRSALVTVRRISGDVASESMVELVTGFLAVEDTDLQYEAITALCALRPNLPTDEFRRYLEPLTRHPNAVLQHTACKALEGLASSEV
jgi:hypothetical protein